MNVTVGFVPCVVPSMVMLLLLCITVIIPDCPLSNETASVNSTFIDVNGDTASDGIPQNCTVNIIGSKVKGAAYARVLFSSVIGGMVFIHDSIISCAGGSALYRGDYILTGTTQITGEVRDNNDTLFVDLRKVEVSVSVALGQVTLAKAGYGTAR